MNPKPTNTAGDPSDLELMLYADGELDDERCAEVEAYLARAEAGSRKLAALNIVSGIVREQALDRAGAADGIADAVMAKLTANGASAAAKPSKPAPVVAAPREVAKVARPDKPANDNGRGIFALAALAVAAAAGLMLWGRMGAEPQGPQGPVAALTATAEQSTALPQPAKAAEPLPDAEDEHGVEVAAVDFGARMGTIFYVPTGAAASNATTTVVWLNDDAAGGER